jgi:hypothetical protein
MEEDDRDEGHDQIPDVGRPSDGLNVLAGEQRLC